MTTEQGLQERDTTTGTRGILRAVAGARRFALDRGRPSAALAPFVDRWWVVRWDLPAGETYEQHVLPAPAVHLIVEGDDVRIQGPQSVRFTRVLRDAGGVVGVQFRPAGFRPFLGAPVATITDRVVPARAVLGDGADALAAAVRGVDTPAASAALLDEHLRALAPRPTAAGLAVSELVERLDAAPDVVRVDQLAARLGIGTRRLQRLFAEHVGLSPKDVIRRRQLQDAAERAADTAPVDWARLAVELGFSDQAHLTRTFTAVVGTPPARYRRDAVGDAPPPRAGPR